MKANGKLSRLNAGLGVLLCAVTVSTRATTITVTSTADSGAGSLRDALVSAVDGDTINFAVTTPATIRLTSGELLVLNSVTILGPGPTNLTLYGDAVNWVFRIANAVTVSISSLTITNGRTGIYNDHSTLTVNNCSVNGNSSQFGGGINNDHGTLTVSNCTLRGNSANYGAGIFNAGTATVSVSTLSGNSVSGLGGGIYNDAGNTLIVRTCTLSGNTAGSYGGGILNDHGTLKVSASTFSGNSGSLGGSIFSGYTGSASLEIGDTILKAGGGGSIVNGDGTVTSRGYNISSDDGGGVLTGTADQINKDPKLGPLQNNGGPTFTHSLLPGSLAIDKGKRNAVSTLASNTDQRGFPRPVDFTSITNASGGDGSDIGAFELQVASTPLLLSAPQKLGNGAFQFTFTNTPGVNFTVLTSTNIALPLSNWIVLGSVPTQIAPGQYQFTDPQATNSPRGFYRVKAP